MDTQNVKPKLNKNVIYILVGVVVFLVIIIVAVLILTRNSNNTSIDNRTNLSGNASNNQATQTDSYPEGICPDEIIYGRGLPLGVWGGKEYSVKVDDIEWLDSECKKDSSSQLSGEGAPIFNQKCTPLNEVKFSKAFTDYENIKHIIPSGAAVGDTIKAHSYVALNSERINLYAPADMYLVQGVYYKEPSSFVAKTTYILHFLVGCDFVINYDHITDPVDKIRVVLNQTPNEGTGMENFLSEPIFFKAGELVGSTIGAGSPELIKTFDFGLYNKNYTNKFINQARYVQNFDWKNLNAVCAFDYFSDDLKNLYYNKLSTLSGRFVRNCRSPSQDIEGTLSGAWHKNTNDSPVAHRVGIAADIDGKSLTITGIDNFFFTINDSEPTFMNPANVKGEHCYYDSSNNQFAFFRITSATEMEAYVGNSKCPTSFDSIQAKKYYR